MAVTTCYVTFFIKASPALRSTAGASRDHVTSAVVKSGSTLRLLLVTSARSPFRHSPFPRLTMPGAERLSALLFVWILCGVTGSAEAQTPTSSESRFILVRQKLRIRVVWGDSLGSARSHMTRKVDLRIITRRTIITLVFG